MSPSVILNVLCISMEDSIASFALVSHIFIKSHIYFFVTFIFVFHVFLVFVSSALFLSSSLTRFCLRYYSSRYVCTASYNFHVYELNCKLQSVILHLLQFNPFKSNFNQGILFSNYYNFSC